MPVIATLGAASVRGFGGFYATTAISASNWIAKAGQYLYETSFDGVSNLYSIGTLGLVIKTASDGSATWKKTITTGGLQITWDKVATVSPNVIYATGSYFQSATVPFFVVLSGDGSVASARSITTGGTLSRLAVSSSGSVYTSGYINPVSGGSTVVDNCFRIVNGAITTKRYYNNTAEVNFGFIGSGGSDSAYLGGSVSTAPFMKINSSFSVLWKAFSSFIDALAVVESNSDLYVVGQYSTGPLLFVMKLNANTGAFVWAKTLSTSNRAVCVAVDSSSNVYVGGRTASNGVILKVDSSGNLVWQRSVSIGVASQIKSIAVNTATNTIYALSSPTSTSNNYSFILSIPTDGSLTGTYSVGGSSVTYASTSETFDAITPTFTSPAFSFTTSTLADASRATTVATATPSYDLITVP
jgi:hypothetical protein